jgi:hypothetical protein
MHLRPALPNLLVPDPDAPPHARWLPPEGRDVPDNQYWRRRLADGAVVRVTAPPRRPRTPRRTA